MAVSNQLIIEILLLFAQTAISRAASQQGRSTPTLYAGNAQYRLQGCYNELSSPATSRALGQSGTYTSPPFSTPQDVTASLCLEGCGNARVPVTGGNFTYVAVENQLNCFCGLTLSDQSESVSDDLCSSPCISDPGTSCGGPGYIALYKLVVSDLDAKDSTSSSLSSPTSVKTSNTASRTTKPTLSAFNTQPSNTTSTTPTFPALTATPKSKKKSYTLTWILVSLGLFLLAALVTGALIYESRRFKARRSAKTHSITSPSSPFPLSLPFGSPSIPVLPLSPIDNKSYQRFSGFWSQVPPSHGDEGQARSCNRWSWRRDPVDEIGAARNSNRWSWREGVDEIGTALGGEELEKRGKEKRWSQKLSPQRWSYQRTVGKTLAGVEEGEKVSAVDGSEAGGGLEKLGVHRDGAKGDGVDEKYVRPETRAAEVEKMHEFTQNSSEEGKEKVAGQARGEGQQVDQVKVGVAVSGSVKRARRATFEAWKTGMIPTSPREGMQ